MLAGAALCPAADNGFERALLPLLENHCFNGHDEDTQKGDLALDSLNPDVVNGGDEAVWAVVLDQLNSGEMPPKKKKRPPEKRLLIALDWLTEELDKAEVAANARGGHIVMRRLNRLDYRNTIRDLFGHPFDPTELFSPDKRAAYSPTRSPSPRMPFLASPRCSRILAVESSEWFSIAASGMAMNQP